MPGEVPAEMVLSVGVSPAFFGAIGLYAAAALFYLGFFIRAPRALSAAARWALVLAFIAHGVEIGWRGVEGAHPGTSVREALGFFLGSSV